MGLTMLTIESPAEGEKVTLARAASRTIRGPGGHSRPPGERHVRSGTVTIHKQRGGRYWYYWVIIIGGTIFVVAALATDMFGLGSGY